GTHRTGLSGAAAAVAMNAANTVSLSPIAPRPSQSVTRASPLPKVALRVYRRNQSEEKGPAARRRPKAAREAYSLCGLSVRPRAPTKQMGPSRRPSAAASGSADLYPLAYRALCRSVHTLTGREGACYPGWHGERVPDAGLAGRGPTARAAVPEGRGGARRRRAP